MGTARSPRRTKSDPPIIASRGPSDRDEQLCPARHSYPVGVIGLFLRMVLSAATSIRSAAGVLDLVADHLPFTQRTPCPNTGRLWLLRIGLFGLTCEKQKADDWIWMMDHTLQLGPYKCLIIVGIRSSAWESERPLAHEDMALLNLTPMEKSTGEQVHEQLEAVVRKTGIPLAVVSDEGTDLKRGMEFFQQAHPQIRHHLDMKHKNALLLKKELGSDPRWTTFVTQANGTKLATTQTSLAFLNPPGLKTKARYMNLDTLVRWGTQALAYLDAAAASLNSPVATLNLPVATGNLPVDRQKLEEKMGWLQSYRPDLERWSELLTVARTAEKLVQGGVHSLICDELREQLRPHCTTNSTCTTPTAQRMRDNVLTFLREQSTGMSGEERLIGSTEVLESIIGKYKRVQSSHSKGGMTAMLLSIGAMVGKQTPAGIKQALEEIRTADVKTWCTAHLGITLQSQRRLALSATKPE